MNEKEELKKIRFDIARLKTDMKLIQRINKLVIVDEIKKELGGVTQVYGTYVDGNKTIREPGYVVSEVKSMLERICNTPVTEGSS